jgi:hypothetical protein
VLHAGLLPATELIPHLWEDHQEEMFARLRGQFAIAVYDARPADASTMMSGCVPPNSSRNRS